MLNSNNLQRHPSNPSVAQGLHKKALLFLALTVFMLTAFPLMNIKPGPVPIYFIDGPAFLAWYYAGRANLTRRYPLQGLAVFILLAMLISELLAGIRLGTLLQPVYIIIRTLLATSLFFSTPRIIQTPNHLRTILKAGLLGALITATLMITSSLPQTQKIVARYVFSHSFLLPSSDSVAAKFGFANMALRGHSLVGVSILTAAFLNTTWPLLFVLRADQTLGKRWRIALLGAVILIPFGVVMSYSREAILGLLVIVVVVLLLNSSKVRRPIVIGVGLSILIFSWAGWDSQYFKFEWLQDKTLNQLENPYTSVGTTERLFAYSEPFQHLIQNPAFLFFGQGFARRKVRGNFLQAGSDAATHAVFASAYYGYGMLAAFAYLLLLAGAFRLTWRFTWQAGNDFGALFARAMLAALFGLSSWFLMGHAPVSEPRGAMFLFFIFGLVVAQTNFATAPRPVAPEPRPLPLRNAVKISNF